MGARAWAGAVALLFAAMGTLAGQDAPRRVFVSVDMEGIGGIGTSAMTRSAGGKDYELGRELATAEVNAVVAALRDTGPVQVVVNDSHGDMQNLLHTRLDPDVEYIQGAIKPLGMVQGLDGSFDAAIFVGYHARAGTEDGFLAHTGSGAVKGLWINGIEVGEGGLNALFAASMGVPVWVASGDSAFVAEFSALSPATRTVSTKTAVGAQVARLIHPERVRDRLAEAVRGAASARISPLAVDQPVTVRVRFATTTRPDILEVIPGVRRVDGYSVEFDADTMDAAYRMIRLSYRFVSF